MNRLYPINEIDKPRVWQRLRKADKKSTLDEIHAKVETIRALITDEKRCPKAGEWFVWEGPFGEAVCANADLIVVRTIAKLVVVNGEEHTPLE